MSQPESAHGKLTPVDQRYTGTRFMIMLAGTLVVALVIIFVMASVKNGDFSWHPFAHDLGRHTFETSAM